MNIFDTAYKKVLDYSAFAAATVLLVCCGAVSLQAQVESTLYGASTRELFCAPRQLSLANSDRVFSPSENTFVNPSLCGINPVNSALASYAGYFGNTFGVSLVSSGIRINNHEGVVLMVGYLAVPGIENNLMFDTTDSGDPIVDESRIIIQSASHTVFYAGYGKTLLQKKNVVVAVGAGCSGSRIRLPESTGYATGYGIGLDGSATVDLPQIGLRSSLIVEDITSGFVYWNNVDQRQILPRAYVGLGWNRDFPAFYSTILLVYVTPDLFGNQGVNAIERSNADSTEIPVYVSARLDPVKFLSLGRIGIQYSLGDVSVRGGINALSQVSFGGGVRLLQKKVSVDFAYLHHYFLPGTYQASVAYRW